MDEVVAMQKAGLKDRDIINRLKATDQYFELTSDQEQYLRDHDVDNTVIDAMRTMGNETDNARRASDTSTGEERISHDKP
jgi:CHASE3 domain sensor protein